MSALMVPAGLARACSKVGCAVAFLASSAIVCGSLVVSTAEPGATLADRPLIGALADPAIGYYSRATTDALGDWNRKLADGSSQIVFDPIAGYLKPTLAALHVPVESQMLVMSKTGIQGLHTAPDNPRAIYFNDVATVGYIRGAPLLEIAIQDPTQGIIFYTIDQKPAERPVFERREGCLTCHQAYATLHVPGMLERSVYVGKDGLALAQWGSFDPDDRSPFRQRWGGWYITGTHGAMRHMGNAIVTGGNRDEILSDRTLDRASVEDSFDSKGYVSATSDIAALMVFLHQGRAMNLVTRIGWEARIAAQKGSLDLEHGALLNGIHELVDYFLFVDEEPIPSPIKGTSGFAEVFAKRGPVDGQGRSLRQLDLGHRLQRYPCSYMIYSPAFSALPDAVRAAIYRRMWEVLSGHDSAPKYARLTEVDRRTVIEILRGTLHDLPPEFLSSDLAR
ncbi:MAG TPA: hypothetical protein VH497_06335 [Vicinamibacterales bacterium]